MTDAAAELIEARRVNEKEVTLKGLSVDLNCALDIHFDDGDLASVLNALKLVNTGAIQDTFSNLTMFDEVLVCHLLSEGRL